MRQYKLRKAPGGGMQLRLPRELADLVPEDTYFEPELVEDGILYRIVKPPDHEQVPSWAKVERAQ